MLHFIKKYFNSLLLCFVSVGYGIMLIRYSTIIGDYDVYQKISRIVDDDTIGYVFIVLALIKFVGLLLNCKWMRRIALSGLTGVWLLFSVFFMFSHVPNTVWLFSLGFALLAFGIAWRSDL